MSAASNTMRLLVGGLDSVEDAVLDQYIALAAARIDRTAWGDLYVQGCVLLAGHLYLRAQMAGAAAGAVASESAGGLSRSYAQVQGNKADAEYLTTAPGSQYIALRKRLGLTPYATTLQRTI
jgi:hypothetical protein